MTRGEKRHRRDRESPSGEEARRADRESPGDHPCADCGGSGLVRVERRLTLRTWFTDESCVEQVVVDKAADACRSCAALAEAEYQARRAGSEPAAGEVPGGGKVIRLSRGARA